MAETAATEMVSDDNLAELIVNLTHKVKRGATVSTRCENPTCPLNILRLRRGQTQGNLEGVQERFPKRAPNWKPRRPADG